MAHVFAVGNAARTHANRRQVKADTAAQDDAVVPTSVYGLGLRIKYANVMRASNL